jgi:hypothetical protein
VYVKKNIIFSVFFAFKTRKMHKIAQKCPKTLKIAYKTLGILIKCTKLLSENVLIFIFIGKNSNAGTLPSTDARRGPR